MSRYQTLHAHTSASDGKMSHQEILELCAKKNIGVVAFTEHDLLPSKETVDRLRKNKSGTDWIIGVELSSGTSKETGSKASSGVHVIGLFIDPFDKGLKEYSVKAIDSRLERMQRIVKNLKSIGVNISVDDCMKESGGESVGRPHIVAAINHREENRRVIKNIAGKMKIQSEKNKETKEKYEKMIKEPIERYPYYLFLQDDAFLEGIYVDYLYFKDFDESVSLIRNAGGLALLAHWFTCKKQINEELLSKILSEDRLDGVETVCGLWAGGRLPTEEINLTYSFLKSLTKKFGKLDSGGCDAHSSGDFDMLVKEKWYAERTVGLAEKIISQSGVDTTWSSFK